MEKITAKSTITINAKIHAVWNALITPDKVQQFMLGMQPHSTWAKGGELRWIGRHEEKPDDNARGQITELIADSKLAYTFYYPGYGYPDEQAYYNLVSFDLKPEGDSTLVTVEQGDFSVFKEGSEFVKHSQQFWDAALQKLKEIAEG